MKPWPITVCLCCLQPRAIKRGEQLCDECLRKIDRELHPQQKELVRR